MLLGDLGSLLELFVEVEAELRLGDQQSLLVQEEVQGRGVDALVLWVAFEGLVELAQVLDHAARLLAHFIMFFRIYF